MDGETRVLQGLLSSSLDPFRRCKVHVPLAEVNAIRGEVRSTGCVNQHESWHESYWVGALEDGPDILSESSALPETRGEGDEVGAVLLGVSAVGELFDGGRHVAGPGCSTYESRRKVRKCERVPGT